MAKEEGYRLFPPSHEAMRAMDLYQRVFPRISKPRNEVYFSRPVTGGLAKYLFEAGKDEISPQTLLVLNINKELGKRVSTELEPQFGGKQLTFPPFFRFGELEAISFWMYFISGLDIKRAQQFELVKLGLVETRLVNDLRAERAVRFQEYRRLLEEFVGFLQKPESPINPVTMLILFPGHEQSLGCTLEKELAKELGVTIKEAVFDGTHPKFLEVQQVLRGIILREETYQPVKDFNFRLPIIRGDGKTLLLLRDYPV